MAKKRRKKKRSGAKIHRAPTPEETGPTQPGRASFSRPVLGLAVAVLVLALAVAGWLTLPRRSSVPNTEETAQRGQAALSRVETFPCTSRDHVQPDTQVDYSTDPPVCGPHYATWLKPGIYTAEQVPEELVHSLEHGYVVIYYDRPGQEVLRTLQDLAERFTGEWDGVVVVPRPGLDQAVILTAWGKMLRFEAFDVDAAMTFINAYRGRGPEHPVR
ncbi:MAG: DUF3105 domain-containing protein [Anaerolineae bacterium]